MDEFTVGELVRYRGLGYIVTRVGAWGIVVIVPLDWETRANKNEFKVDSKTLTKDLIGTLLYG